jgi:hypothetical protein
LILILAFRLLEEPPAVIVVNRSCSQEVSDSMSKRNVLLMSEGMTCFCGPFEISAQLGKMLGLKQSATVSDVQFRNKDQTQW